MYIQYVDNALCLYPLCLCDMRNTYTCVYIILCNKHLLYMCLHLIPKMNTKWIIIIIMKRAKTFINKEYRYSYRHSIYYIFVGTDDDISKDWMGAKSIKCSFCILLEILCYNRCSNCVIVASVLFWWEKY